MNDLTIAKAKILENYFEILEGEGMCLGRNSLLFT